MRHVGGVGGAQRGGGVRQLQSGARVSVARQQRALAVEQLGDGVQQVVEAERERRSPQPVQLLRGASEGRT